VIGLSPRYIRLLRKPLLSLPPSLGQGEGGGRSERRLLTPQWKNHQRLRPNERKFFYSFSPPPSLFLSLSLSLPVCLSVCRSLYNAQPETFMTLFFILKVRTKKYCVKATGNIIRKYLKIRKRYYYFNI